MPKEYSYLYSGLVTDLVILGIESFWDRRYYGNHYYQIGGRFYEIDERATRKDMEQTARFERFRKQIKDSLHSHGSTIKEMKDSLTSTNSTINEVAGHLQKLNTALDRSDSTMNRLETRMKSIESEVQKIHQSATFLPELDRGMGSKEV